MSFVMKIESSSNKNFFMISRELEGFQRAQLEMASNQNKNWEIVEKQFEVFEKNIHIVVDCTQLLFSNQQLNLISDTMASLLAILYADIKSYRSALFAFRMNLTTLNSHSFKQDITNITFSHVNH